MKRGPQPNPNQQGRNVKARTEDFAPQIEQHQYVRSQNEISVHLRNQQANNILTSFQVTIDRHQEEYMNNLSEADQEKVYSVIKNLGM